jgi:hypothetical protein
MNNNQTMVVGVFRQPTDAQSCYDILLERGFGDDQFNLMMSEQTRTLFGRPIEQRPHEADHHHHHHGGESRAMEGMGVGGAIGTAIGGSIAAIAAIGTSLLVPGLNVIVAGPLAAALAGGGAGAVTGGLLGGLIGLGIKEDKVETYHKAIHEGCTVLGVALRTSDRRETVEQAMKACNAENIHVSS